MSEIYFVVTTGRSGSTTMAHLIGEMKNCYSVHEPAPQLILESANYRYGIVSKSEIHRLLRETRPISETKKIYCESNQTLSLLIPELVSVFPRARFIWLIRNGLDVVASTYQKQWYTGHSENHTDYEACSAVEKAWIDGRIRGDKVGEMAENEWLKLSRFEKCCWYWGYVNGIISDDLRRHAPHSYKLVKLEELTKALPGLEKWIGGGEIGNKKIVYENVARRIPHHWSNWTETEKSQFAMHCGSPMDSHYPGWREIVFGTTSEIFFKPAINSLHKQIEIANHNSSLQAERIVSLNRRASKAEGQLNWLKQHWSYKWYRWFRLLLDRLTNK